MALTSAAQRKTAERGRSLKLREKIDELEDLGRDAAAEPSRRAAISASVADGGLARVRLERVLDGNELTDIAYLQRGVIASRAVCRIRIRARQRIVGHGTGFLVAPGVLMTNQHVLEDADDVATSIAQFRYELGLSGTELSSVGFHLRTDIPPIFDVDNDLALVAVEDIGEEGESLDQFGWLRLDPTPGKAVLGEHLTVIQHPGGEHKQVCVRENRLIKYDPDGHYLWYATDTVGGSSGSPVFNNSWDVVGLHHAGVPRTATDRNGDLYYKTKDNRRWRPGDDPDDIDFFANEGIRISRIMRFLAERHPESPIARAVLDTPPAPMDAGTPGLIGSPSTGYALPLSVPLTVRIGGGGQPVISVGQQPAAPSSGPRLAAVDATPTPAVQESENRSTDIDQTNYDERNGFQRGFLGDRRSVSVKIPVVGDAAPGELLEVGGRSRFHYWNYTVQMNKPRRLAYYCAANVDPALAKGKQPSRHTWELDPRIGDDEEFQLASWYGEQKEFESTRALNPFDKGHLTARDDLQWGETLDEAFRNGDESYHWSNCAPQHFAFNQNKNLNGLWRSLETFVIRHTGGRRLSIINGPVFDAPPSESIDGVMHLRLDGDRVDDPTFGGVQIPKMYFKIIAWVGDDGRLDSAGFIVTQENVLSTVDRLVEATFGDAEIQLYQQPVATIERVTDIDFGANVRRSDTNLLQTQEATGQSGLITSESDLCLP